MRADDPNLPILIVIVQALGDLKDEMVFVGGCAAGLLLTDPAVDHIRATNDVDAIVEVAALNDFYVAESRLEARGFVRNMPSELICRWEHRASGVLFDMMPVDPSVLGFANRWYPEAVHTATRQQIFLQLFLQQVQPWSLLAKMVSDVSQRKISSLTF